MKVTPLLDQIVMSDHLTFLKKTDLTRSKASKTNLDDSPTIHTGFVIALYDGEPYVGKVLSYDDDDEEYNIDFMQDAGKAEDTFRWPTPADVLWINRHNIVAAIEEPMPTTSKYTRLYKLSPNDLEAFKLNK